MNSSNLARSSQGEGVNGKSETTLSSEDFIRRARDIGQSLIALQADTEERSRYSEQTHEKIKEAGLYRMLVPRRFGGYEVDIGTFMQVVVELSACCASTGWQFALGSAHALSVATFFPEEAQAAIFGDGHFVAASAAKPSITATRVDGGWRLNGSVSYASGLPYSTHYMGFALVPPEFSPTGFMTFIAPRETWTMLEDWGDTLGLRGSGSNSVNFEDVFIPDIYVLYKNVLLESVADGTPGFALHGNPLYSGRGFSAYTFEAAAPNIGMLRAATEIYRELMLTKMTSIPPATFRAENADFQRYYGRILARLDAADRLFRDLCGEYTKACNRNASGEEPFDDRIDSRLAQGVAEICQICWDTMQGIILPTAGPAEFKTGKRLERVFRDMAMARAHVINVMFEGQNARMVAIADLARGAAN